MLELVFGDDFSIFMEFEIIAPNLERRHTRFSNCVLLFILVFEDRFEFLLDFLLNLEFVFGHGSRFAQFKLFFLNGFAEGQEEKVCSFVLEHLLLSIGVDCDRFVDFSDFGFIEELDQGSLVVLQSLEFVKLEFSGEKVDRWS